MSQKQINFDSVISVPINNRETFYKYWIEFLAPLHHLSNKEQQVLAGLFKIRYRIKNKYPNLNEIMDYERQDEEHKEILRSYYAEMFSKENRKELAESLHIDTKHLAVQFSYLVRKGILRSSEYPKNFYSINPKFLPRKDRSAKNAKILIYFDFKDFKDE